MSFQAPPNYVKYVLSQLESRGHLAYLVGGCVRDMILGVHPHDWDVCTSALPWQVEEIFPHTRATGIKHGTVTVLSSSHPVEVTTFRREGGYADHRHPDAVSFVGDLTEDLARRDFTVNAIALPLEGFAADPFGGIRDIENKLIRCVGDGEKRFEEDALRMLRAFRFSARLDFAIEENTLLAIKEKAYLSEYLAPERVRDELEKLLLTKKPDTVYELIGAGLLDGFLSCRLPEEGLPTFSRMPHKAMSRFMLLCAVLKSHGCISSAEEFLTRLRLDSRTVRCCDEAEEMLRSPVPECPLAWKRLLNRYGAESVLLYAQCLDARSGGKNVKALKAVLKSGECYSAKHLAVTGDDLLELGYRGRELGEMLRFLLDYVMEHPENNTREILLSLAGGTEEI